MMTQGTPTGQRTSSSKDCGTSRSASCPAPVAPADLVETTETDPPHQESEQPPVRREWGRAAAGNPAPERAKDVPATAPIQVITGGSATRSGYDVNARSCHPRPSD